MAGWVRTRPSGCGSFGEPGVAGGVPTLVGKEVGEEKEAAEGAN